jgi:dihydroneopterin aldolase
MFLHGIEAHGHHGVFEAEQREGQRFVVDVDWWFDAITATTTDRLVDTICYQRLYEVVVAEIGGERWNLIESLAQQLSMRLLELFPMILALRVVVHKPDAPIGGAFSDVGVAIQRCRSS